MRKLVSPRGSRAAKLTSFLLMAWLLNACETLPPASTAPLSGISVATSFSLIGRLSVRSGERIDSVKLIWMKSGRGERLQFFTPFGSQIAEVSQMDGGIATLRQGGVVTTADSLGALTAMVLNVTLDTGEIGQWIQSVGLKDGESRELYAQDGSAWRVMVERMQTATAVHRPGEIFRYAARLTAVKGEISLRLVVDEWQAL